MKLTLKILLTLSIIYLLNGCGTTKIKSSTATKTTVKSVETKAVKEVVNIETKHFGDTLKGVMPLPKLTKEPVVLTVESGGTKLDLILTDNKLTYKVVPKHIATTTINSVKESDTKAVADVVQVEEAKAVSIKEPWRPPWWSYLLFTAIIIGVVSYYLKPIKTSLKPILKIFINE